MKSSRNRNIQILIVLVSISLLHCSLSSPVPEDDEDHDEAAGHDDQEEADEDETETDNSEEDQEQQGRGFGFGGSCDPNESKPPKSLSKSPWIKGSEPPQDVIGQSGRSLSASFQLNGDSGNKFRYISSLTRLGHINMAKLTGFTDPFIPKKFKKYTTPNPTDLLHAAVVAFGYVFEFTFDSGIDATDEKKYFELYQPLWEESSDFTTDRTPEEVQKWLKKNMKNFNHGTYHVIHKNCLHFAKALGDYLGGSRSKTEPEKFALQRVWLKEHTPIGLMINEMLRLSMKIKRSRNCCLGLLDKVCDLIKSYVHFNLTVNETFIISI